MRWLIALLTTILAWPTLFAIDVFLWCRGGKVDRHWRGLRAESKEGLRTIWRSRTP
jgi:hypothetical protein